MRIEDFIPNEPTFVLGKTGKTYTLRIPTIADRVKLDSMAGGNENINKAFSTLDFKQISRFVYFLLTDKSDLMASQVSDVDEFGNKFEVVKSGPDKLFELLQNNEEGFKMIAAFNSAIASSEPALRKAMVKELEKKNLIESQTSIGDTSLTSSQASTDTPPISSETLPSAS